MDALLAGYRLWNGNSSVSFGNSYAEEQTINTLGGDSKSSKEHRAAIDTLDALLWQSTLRFLPSSRYCLFISHISIVTPKTHYTCIVFLSTPFQHSLHEHRFILIYISLALASVMISGATINVIVKSSRFAVAWTTTLPVLVAKWFLTSAGIGSIPFIVNPFDRFVDYSLDNTTRRWIDKEKIWNNFCYIHDCTIKVSLDIYRDYSKPKTSLYNAIHLDVCHW